MTDDNTVQINFSASTDDALDGIAEIRDGLTGLGAPVSGLSGNLGRLGAAFGASLPLDQLAECANGLGNVGMAAQGAASQVQGIGAQLQVLRIHLSEQKMLLDAEVGQFQITQNQKYALLAAETQREYGLERDLLRAWPKKN